MGDNIHKILLALKKKLQGDRRNIKTGIRRRGDSYSRKRFTIETSSAAANCTRKSIFPCRIMFGLCEAEERKAQMGDISNKREQAKCRD